MNEENTPEKEDVAEMNKEDIDIYLFSNGQQYSPPRKYHLRADELTYWEPTLAFLARSQYGELCTSIQLFELDGRKVESAKNIRDCAVYVAVVPPDPFIYSGYDKYLVKASRSYERRFSKTNGEQSKPDSLNDPTQKQYLKAVDENKTNPPCTCNPKNCDLRKSSIRYSNQKYINKTEPVANQVSQRLPHNENMSDNAATKIYNSVKKNSPNYNSRTIVKASGIPIKILNTDRGRSVNRTKSTAKTLSFDSNNVQKRNPNSNIRQNPSNTKPGLNTKFKKKTTASNTIITAPLSKTSKLISDTETPEKDDFIIKGTTGQEEVLNKQSGNHSHGALNDLEKTINLLLIPTAPATISDAVHSPPSASDKNNLKDLSDNISTKGLATNSNQIKNILNVTNDSLRATNCNIYSKFTLREPSIKTNLNAEKNEIEKQLLDKESIPNTERKSIVLDKTNALNNCYTLRTNSELISLLNERRALTEPHSFIGKSQEKLKINNKELLVLVNERNEIMHTDTILNTDKKESRKLHEEDNSVLINKSNPIKAKVTSKNPFECVDSDNRSENKINRPVYSTSTSHTVMNEIHKPVYDYVPENIFDSKSRLLLDVTESKDIKKDALRLSKFVTPSDATDIFIKTENLDSTNVHSFIFYIKKEYDRNTNRVSKANVNNNIHDSFSNVLDSDIVRVSVFRSSVNELILSSKFDNNTIQSETQSRVNRTENINTVDHNQQQITSSASDKNSTNIAFNTPSQNATTDNDDKFIALVNKGDTVNLKLTIQVTNAEGILKSTQTLTTHKLNSGSHQETDELNDGRNRRKRSKSLELIINKAPTHICCRKDTVDAYNCPCCSYRSICGNITDRNILAAAQLKPGLQGLYILVPVPTLTESGKLPNPSLDKEVQLAESLLNFVSIVMEKELDLSIQTSTQMDSSMQQTTKDCLDQSTQTDWWDVLLEARAETDGHYAFYLPPLSLLQQYKFW